MSEGRLSLAKKEREALESQKCILQRGGHRAHEGHVADRGIGINLMGGGREEEEGRGKEEGSLGRNHTTKNRETESSVECLDFHRQKQLFFYKEWLDEKLPQTPCVFRMHAT